MLITLNSNERITVEHMAKMRYEHCRRVGARLTIYSDAEAMENEINSFGGEFAFCKHWNLYPDFDDNTFAHHDATMADGRTVDVKTTPLKTGRLQAKKLDKKKMPDFYALMIGTFPDFHYMGMMDTERLIVPERIDHRQKHPVYVATQAELLEYNFG
jgi:hypothetical protein